MNAPLPATALQETAAWDNPMGLMGFEFVEFTSPTPGVLEAVFVALLAPPLTSTALIAAVLCYRAVYYWAPLAVAVVLYLAMEAQARRLATQGASTAH